MPGFSPSFFDVCCALSNEFNGTVAVGEFVADGMADVTDRTIFSPDGVKLRMLIDDEYHATRDTCCSHAVL